MGRVTSRYRVLRVADGVTTVRPDTLAAEEPLEIRVAGRPLSVTMRTPGDDFDLARGFLVSEGVVAAESDIAAIRYCAGATADGGNTYNVLDVLLADGVPLPDVSVERNFYTTSSCGICGKASLLALRTVCPPRSANCFRVNARVLYSLTEKLRAAQNVFEKTGGLHASAIFDAEGELYATREDVGRHNAVDKLLGAEFLADRTPLRDRLLLLSGRASFELLQKALMGGISMVVAVGAPSSLAVQVAKEFDITLVGFLRGDRFNVYHGSERILGNSELVPGKI